MTPLVDRDGVTLYRGDCLDVLPTLPEASADALITDPPYFQPASHYCAPRDEKAPKKAIGDMSILEHFFRSFIRECVRVLKPTGSAYIFCDGQSYPIAFTGLYPCAKYVRPLIWDKLTSVNGYTWRHQHELIAWGEWPDTPRIPTGDGDVLRFQAVPVKDRIHPAEKPVGLIKALVMKTPEGGTVLDPFMGSGTTAAACVQLGRKFIGVEIDEGYFKVADGRCASPYGPLFSTTSADNGNVG